MECVIRSNVPEEDSIVPDFINHSAATSSAVLMIEDLCSGVQGLRQVCASNVATFEIPSDFAFDFKLAEFFPVCTDLSSGDYSLITHRFCTVTRLIIYLSPPLRGLAR